MCWSQYKPLDNTGSPVHWELISSFVDIKSVIQGNYLYSNRYMSHPNPATFTPDSVSGLTQESFFSHDEHWESQAQRTINNQRWICNCLKVHKKLEFQKKCFFIPLTITSVIHFWAHFQLCTRQCSCIVFTMWRWTMEGNGFYSLCLCQPL